MHVRAGSHCLVHSQCSIDGNRNLINDACLSIHNLHNSNAHISKTTRHMQECELEACVWKGFLKRSLNRDFYVPRFSFRRLPASLPSAASPGLSSPSQSLAGMTHGRNERNIPSAEPAKARGAGSH